MTSTKRKAILKELSGHQGRVPIERLKHLSSRHQVPLVEVREMLTINGYLCQHVEPVPRPVRVTEPAPKALPVVTPQEAHAIRTGMVYRSLDDTDDWVVVRREAFERERAVIIRMLDALDL